MERWKKLRDFPGYEVSNRARVRHHGRIIDASTNGQGVVRVNLRRDRVNYTRSLSRLVCREFHGEPKENEVVIYKDNDQSNCDADNLYWGDRGFAWERKKQSRSVEPMRVMKIERIETGEIFSNSLDCARAVDGIEKYIVLCAGDPINRFYKGSNYRWVV